MNDKERTRSASQLRQLLMDRCETQAQKVFKEHRAIQSIALLVAQFWDDEADDAVHGMFICSELESPDIDAGLKAYDEPDDDAAWDYDYDEGDPVNLPSFTRHDGPEFYPGWNSNGDGIPAFAAYCSEGGDQCSPAKDNYTLYAIFFRDGRVKTVGTQLRPHLDGHPEELLMKCLEWASKR